jgi:hypothetical protein
MVGSLAYDQQFNADWECNNINFLGLTPPPPPPPPPQPLISTITAPLCWPHYGRCSPPTGSASVCHFLLSNKSSQNLGANRHTPHSRIAIHIPLTPVNRRSQMGAFRPCNPVPSFQANSEAKSGSLRQINPCEVGNGRCARKGTVRRKAHALPEAALPAPGSASVSDCRQVFDGRRASYPSCIFIRKTSQFALRIRGLSLFHSSLTALTPPITHSPYPPDPRCRRSRLPAVVCRRGAAGGADF